MRTILFLFLVAALPGCTAVEFAGGIITDNTLIAGVAAYSATSEIIARSEDPAGRARRILVYTDAALDLVSADKPVTLDVVYHSIYSLIDWQKIPAVDRPIIEDLLQAVRDGLAREIEKNMSMTPETEVSLSHVVERIRMAAEFYAHG